MVKTKGVPLPDIDELNEAAPKSEWRDGPNGPQGPWQWATFVYLLDPQTAGRATYVGGSIGARIGVAELQNNVADMRALRGEACCPVVMLGLKPMKTKNFGVRQRPYFQPVRWVLLNTGQAIAPAIEHRPEQKQLPQQPPQGYPDDYQGDGRVTNQAPKLKEVQRPSLREELDDEIDF
jgi:hypothetical protein